VKTGAQVAEGSEQPNVGAGTLHERWREEQREWQRVITAFIDQSANDEAFLMHLGNAMRGSLLAGKPYPGTAPATAAEPAAGVPADLDPIMFALRRLEGRVIELTQVVEGVAARLAPSHEKEGT
jgi:hypothetical protein